MDNFEFKIPKLISMPGKKGRFYLGGIAVGLVFIFLIYQAYRFLVNFPVLSALDHTQQFTPKQIVKSEDLYQINNVIELSNDQNGTMGVIKDVKALSQRKDFFKKARNGDILIIYPNMTIIYNRENQNVVDISGENLLK